MKLNLPFALRLFSTLFYLLSCISIAQALPVTQAQATEKLSIANAIPEAGKLTVELVRLEHQIAKLVNTSPLELEITAIQADLVKPVSDIQALKVSGGYDYAKFREIRRMLKKATGQFEEVSEPLSMAITQLNQLTIHWRNEQQRWEEWHAQLADDNTRQKFALTFSNTEKIINQAQKLLNSRLDQMLEQQQQSNLLSIQIQQWTADLDFLVEQHQRTVLRERSPPMLSKPYMAQFNAALWPALYIGFYEAIWPDLSTLQQDGWIMLLQVMLTLGIGLVIKNKHAILKRSEHWRFIGLRPVSAAVFLGQALSLILYEYAAEFSWNIMMTLLGGISFIRLTNLVIKQAWKKQFILAVVIVLLIFRLLHFFNVPLPVFRLGIALLSILGCGLSCFWLWQSQRNQEPKLYAWLLGLLGGCFAVVFLQEILGKEGLAEYLFSGLIRAIANAFAFLLLSYVFRGLLDWIFWGSPLRRINLLQNEAEQIIQRTNFFFNLLVWGLVYVPFLLMIFRVYDNLPAAIASLLDLGFSVGEQHFTIGLALIAIAIIYGCDLLSWIIQKLMLNGILIPRTIGRGGRISVSRLINYALMFVGYMAVLLLFGFEFTNLAIMLSALGVGIGFGLQGIVNNFISGLILLFEQPVRVGDIIEINGIWAEIKKIGLRATVVETYDQSDIIVPNADLVSSQVTNWTLTNRQVRLIIAVGVAYGSNVPLVIETLMAAADAHPKVSKTRKPMVLFLNFGESSLDFELRAWVYADDRLDIKSDLHQNINQRFIDAHIEIAFPQRDLHIRSIDDERKLPIKAQTDSVPQ